MSDNPSFVLNSIENTVFEDRPIPEISDGDVLIEVKKTGICGSDVHFLADGCIGDYVVKKPMVLGHESSGVVKKVGAKVKSLKAGDRVALEPGATCRICDFCKSGKYQLCRDMVFAATPPTDGTLARYYRLPADVAYKIPESMSLEDGAMIEPLSVAVHAVASTGGFRSTQSCVVFGAGPVGLLCMAVAHALGAERVIAVDIVSHRLQFAKSYAATHTWLPPKMNEGETRAAYSRRNAEAMRKEFAIPDSGPGAIDLVVEASGAEVSIQTGILIARAGGTFVQVGMGTPEVVIPVTHLLTKELTLKGSFRYGVRVFTDCDLSR
jgi:D-xylulose reductase